MREHPASVTGTEIIRTIRGDITPAEVGPCDAHEHLFLVTPAQPGDEFTDVGSAIEEARTLVAAGGQALVDWTPLGLGRDLNGLHAVCDATALHIVAATRLHRDPHYASDDPLRTETEDALAGRFVADLARCGIVKVGAGYHHVTPSGAWLQLDGPGRTKYWPDSTILALIADLAERGHADRLLLGGDTGRRQMAVDRGVRRLLSTHGAGCGSGVRPCDCRLGGDDRYYRSHSRSAGSCRLPLLDSMCSRWAVADLAGGLGGLDDSPFR
jgi:predicted metal-dependent phosphotriesterase family hydrolase